MIEEIPSVADATAHNSSFSKLTPGLQLALDSTSLGYLKECPRKYYYTIVLGIRPARESVHLTFGTLYHGALERYDHARAQGLNHTDALRDTLRWVLCQTWDATLQRPWISDHPAKNRFTLVRTVIDYLDKFGAQDSMTTITLANGKPAVELSFRFATGIYSHKGEEFILCGHLDKLASMGLGVYIVDRKTTLHGLGARFFQGFTPDNQMSLYDLAGRVAFGLDVQGVVIDGASIASGSSSFERAILPRSAPQAEEFLADTAVWIDHAQVYAERAHWPMNDKSCHKYGGCEFCGICGKPPGARDLWLKKEFTLRTWDPLITRGDI